MNVAAGPVKLNTGSPLASNRTSVRGDVRR
jgi:hypothetical protein